MAKDDITLGVEMERLEIEPAKLNKVIKEENPFVSQSLSAQRRSLFTRTCQLNYRCSCAQQKKNKSLPICKKKHTKILKDPILKLLQVNGQDCSGSDDSQVSKKGMSQMLNSETLSLCALVDDCNQLRISSSSYEQVPTVLDKEKTCDKQWLKPNGSVVRNSRDSVPGTNQVGSCSQQALNPPCDITIDELASYFETLVHIPKKMSSMAEMMYI